MQRKINKDILKELFVEYNDLYFNSMLKTPRFGTYKGMTALGTLFTWKDNVKRPKLEIATNVDWTEVSLRSVLVHEMVHLYLWQTDKDGDRRHGKRFKAVMRRLNENYNLGVKTRNSEIHYNDRKPVIQRIWNKIRQIVNH